MVGRTTVLVIKVGEDDPLNALHGALGREEGIELASVKPVSVDEGRAQLGAAPEIGVVVIIGSEAVFPGLVESIRGVRPEIHIVAVSIERGTSILSLRDPTLNGLTRIVRSLIQTSPLEAVRSRSGKVVTLRAGPPMRLLPAPLLIEPDQQALPALHEALAWVESATRNLIAIWSGDNEKTPAFALTWDALEQWLANLVRIADSPAGKVEDTFVELLHKLLDGPYAGAPLGRLAQIVGGDEIAVKLLLVVAAADLDIRFHRMFGALHDDLGRRHPSMGLSCAVIAAATYHATPLTVRAQLAALRRLRNLGLIQGFGSTAPAADEPLRLDSRYVDWLLTGEVEQLAGADEEGLLRVTPNAAAALLSEPRRRLLRRAVRRAELGHGQREIAVLVLTGSAPGWLPAEAAALAGTELRIGPPVEAQSSAVLDAALRGLAAATRLSGRNLVVDLTESGPHAGALWRALVPLLPEFERPPFVVAGNAAELATQAPAAGVVVVDVPEPTAVDRRDAVAAALAPYGGYEAGLIGDLAERFPLPLETLPEAAALALSAAAEAGRPLRLEVEDWWSGFRRAAGARLPRLARRVEPAPRLPDPKTSHLDAVFLPSLQQKQLRALLAHVRVGRIVLEEWGLGALVDAKGVSALFSGESGTGKTMAAHAVASELGADLYVVDLAQVTSKYIGETEKNLDLIFDDAQRAGAVLLFDEADALFGKRTAVSDAHDRYANIEVAYLLQRLQLFSGLTILTSNHPENIDLAFTRRLRFRIEFPRPSPEDRLRIWDQSVPADHREKDLDLAQLAFAMDLTGGVIRQMALHAAVLAAQANRLINFEDLLAGARAQIVGLKAYGDLSKLDAIARGRAEAAEAA